MIVVGALVVAFAMLVTAHVALVWGLAFRPPRWRALASLVVPFLAPFFGLKEKMRVRAWLWIACVAIYTIAFFAAR